MDSKADEYRERAADAEQQAEVARNLDAKRTWRDVAQQWRDMARQAERNGW